MMTLARFRVLVESYGADLRRWPREARDEAEQLRDASPEAQAFLAEARRLDEAIGAATAHQDALRWRAADQDDALARLRAGVAARMDELQPGSRRSGSAPAWLGSLFRLRHVGWITSGAFAVVAGLAIGAMYGSAPAPAGALATLLQPAALDFLAE